MHGYALSIYNLQTMNGTSYVSCAIATGSSGEVEALKFCKCPSNGRLCLPHAVISVQSGGGALLMLQIIV